MKIKQIEKNILVVQSNALIEASYRLTLQEKRLVLILISMIKKNDEDFKAYRFKVKDLAKAFGIKDSGSYYQEVQKITTGLMEKVLGIKEDTGTFFVHWFYYAKYWEKEGYVDLKFAPELKPYLLKIKERFTQFALKNIVKFKSIYTIRIYEFLRQYLNTEHKIRTFELQDFRAKIGLIEFDKKGDIVSEKFKLYADIKRKILIPTQKELKKKADIYFDFEPIKTGRRVSDIKFILVENNDFKPTEPVEPESKKLPFTFKKTKQDIQKNKQRELSKRDIVYQENKEKVNYFVQDILDFTKHEKSKDFYYKIAWKLVVKNKEGLIYQAISETKIDFMNKKIKKNKGAIFNSIIQRLAKENNIDLELKNNFDSSGGLQKSIEKKNPLSIQDSQRENKNNDFTSIGSTLSEISKRFDN